VITLLNKDLESAMVLSGCRYAWCPVQKWQILRD